jgi:hypothetical protein
MHRRFKSSPAFTFGSRTTSKQSISQPLHHPISQTLYQDPTSIHHANNHSLPKSPDKHRKWLYNIALRPRSATRCLAITMRRPDRALIIIHWIARLGFSVYLWGRGLKIDRMSRQDRAPIKSISKIPKSDTVSLKTKRGIHFKVSQKHLLRASISCTVRSVKDQLQLATHSERYCRSMMMVSLGQAVINPFWNRRKMLGYSFGFLKRKEEPISIKSTGLNLDVLIYLLSGIIRHKKHVRAEYPWIYQRWSHLQSFRRHSV